MKQFETLYRDALDAAAGGRPLSAVIQKDDCDPHQLDCLLHAPHYAPVWKVRPCGCEGKADASCISSCLFDAIDRDERGTVTIDPERCTGCSACIQACQSGALTGSRDILTLLDRMKHAKGPVYALIAPAFVGQFREEVTPGRLRSAFKKAGFSGMVEVALFADILTLKEALEFDKMVQGSEDFMITSCCCPVWISLIRKIYSQLMPHVPGTVSPMVACGRCIKRLYPDAVTVFVGPCLAKKAEAKEPDLRDAVDVVLTFEEVRDLFEAFQIDPSCEPDDRRDHASRAGRIYARTSGVSEAVRLTVDRLRPDRTISVKARQADGVPGCRELLSLLREGKLDANFLEGMGCVGGCVGGPKAIVPRDLGTEQVNRYGEQSACETPAENPFVLELLTKLGFSSVESLLEDTALFTRYF